jgi:hypothetical protein
MPRVIILFLLLTIYLASSGQEKSRVQYNGSVEGGILRGARGYAFQVEAINGVRYKRFFAGVGIGIDKYYAKSVPLFGALRMDILVKKKTPFVYLNIGSNLPWVRKEFSFIAMDYWHTVESGNGKYVDGGLGYTVPLKGHLKLLTSLGISLKERTEKKKWGGDGIINDYSEDYKYQFRRYTLKVGLSF